jgi:ABC-type sulfate/molybdate transport systems ATPase subunit
MTWRVDVKGTLGPLEIDVDIGGGKQPLALIGPNGSGKTTLLRMIAGAMRPGAGRIEVDGRTFFDAASDTDVAIEARAVGYMPQGSGLFPHLNVFENVAFGLTVGPNSVPANERRARVDEMLETLDCSGLRERDPSELSGGEQQRVALARALVVDPSILLLDEPLSELDAAARRKTRRLLARELTRIERPSILVTHNVRDVDALEARVVALDAGRVVQTGALDALRAAPANDFVAEFVGA